jgi:Flp pilus assembly protein TadG
MEYGLSYNDRRRLENVTRKVERALPGRPHRFKRDRGRGRSISRIQLAFCAEDAPTGDFIAATLNTPDGPEINVYCHLKETVDLSNAFPLLEDGDPLTIYWNAASGLWYATQIFYGTVDCD